MHRKNSDPLGAWREERSREIKHLLREHAAEMCLEDLVAGGANRDEIVELLASLHASPKPSPLSLNVRDAGRLVAKIKKLAKEMEAVEVFSGDLPQRLRQWADSLTELSKYARLRKPNSRGGQPTWLPRQTHFIAGLIKHVKQTTDDFHDEQVAGLLTAVLTNPPGDIAKWRARHASLISQR